MIKKLAGVFLSDALLAGFALFMLVLLVLVLMSNDHTLVVGESSLVILTLEIGICIFAIIWSAVRVVRNIIRERSQ